MIEILHERDPDSDCGIRVWVDGVELHDFVVLDVDPGRGYEREDWDETTREVAESTELSGSFKAAALSAREIASESKYVE